MQEADSQNEASCRKAEIKTGTWSYDRLVAGEGNENAHVRRCRVFASEGKITDELGQPVKVECRSFFQGFCV